MSSVPASLRTPRLELRRWTIDDLDAVMTAIEASVESLQLWMPWAADGVPSREAELLAFETGIVDFDRDADWQFSLFAIVSGALVGGCGLHRTETAGRVEIGYWTHVDYQGRGYATEATAALVDVAFTSLGWVDEIQVRMDCANGASARVPDKVGFRMIGEEARPISTPGHTGRGLVWSLHRDAWRFTGRAGP